MLDFFIDFFLKAQFTFRKTSIPHVAIFVFIRWSRKKTLMTTDVCLGCVSSPETLQTCCRMILLPLSICFYRYEIKIKHFAGLLDFFFECPSAFAFVKEKENSINVPMFLI